MNTRRVIAIHREIAAIDEDMARLALERARLQKALAEAYEDPEEPAPNAQGDRRPRGRGAMLLRPTRPPSEIDQKRACKALRE